MRAGRGVWLLAILVMLLPGGASAHKLSDSYLVLTVDGGSSLGSTLAVAKSGRET